VGAIISMKKNKSHKNLCAKSIYILMLAWLKAHAVII